MLSLPIITIRKSPSCRVESERGRNPLPPRETPATRIRPSTLSGVDGLADQVGGRRHAHAKQLAAAEALAHLCRRVQQHQLDLLDPPGGRCDRRDVELLVDLGAPRIEDARDHLRHVEVLERDARRHDVGVVPARDRDEGVGLANAGLFQDVAVESQPHDAPRVVARRVVVERLGALVDHGDVVAGLAERVRQLGADTAAAHDHDTHNREEYPARLGVT